MKYVNNNRASNHTPLIKNVESIIDFSKKSIFSKSCSKMDVDVRAATCDVGWDKCWKIELFYNCCQNWDFWST